MPVLIIGAARFDVQQGVLTDEAGEGIPLRSQSLEVLKSLSRRAGDVVDKETLIREVWGGLAVTDDSLTQCIADIRRALGDRQRKIVQTVPKKGYRLIASAQVSRPIVARRHLPVAAGLIPVLVITLITGWGVTRLVGEPTERPDVVERSPVTRTEPSIAVLPFEAVDDQERWVRLGRGFAAEIASDLARNDWLYVTLPESLINVAIGDPPPASEFDVHYVLGGTVQVQGTEIRISAQLTDNLTGEVLWSEIWTDQQDRILSVQDQIIDRISASLGSTFSGVVVQSHLKRAKRKLTTNLNAFEHYLLGFELFHTFDRDALPTVIVHLEAALSADPTFAGALVTLSLAQKHQADFATGAYAQSWFEASQESAYRAYAIDPNNPNVLWNAARAFALNGDLATGQRLLSRAVEIAPNNADVLLISAEFASDVGMHGPEPLAWAERAFELNPMAPLWWYNSWGIAAFGAGQYEKAISILRQGYLGDEAWLYTALSEAHLGNMSKARKAAQAFRELAPDLTVESFAAGTETERPDQHRVFDGARLLGLPITDKDLQDDAGLQEASALVNDM